jgi:hypothetical protein
VFVVSQAPVPWPEDGGDIVASTRAAAASGFAVVSLPPGLLRPDEVEPALADVADAGGAPAVWVGTIPSEALYRAVDAGLRARGIVLVNDPDAHLQVFEFDRAYPRIADLTARSVVISDLAAVEAAARAVGLPAFVKGALLSRKHQGWSACVATTVDELRELAAQLLRRPYFSRGRVVVRELLPLRRFTVPASEFPVGREYRVFLLRGEALAYGYYWPYRGDWAALSGAEAAAMLAAATAAARRLDAPLVSVDARQLEDGAWRVIETGDPQFSGLSFIDPRPLWAKLAARLSG